MSIETTDAADRLRIGVEWLDRTLFVEAGAGTGKTTQLVERICNLVIHEGVPLNEIAAITFTEAAAAELQTRIRVALERRRADGDALVAERCTQALADADRAAISTLHGFANRILGEFAVAAGLPPRLRVLDEVSSQLAAEQRWERFVDELYADPANDELLTRALMLDIPVEAGSGRRASLREVADRLNQDWDRLGSIVKVGPAPLGPISTRPLVDAVRLLEHTVLTCTDPGDKLAMRMNVQVAYGHRYLGLASEVLVQELMALRSGSSPWGNRTVGRSANWPDVELAKSVSKSFGTAVGAVIDGAVDEVLSHLLHHAARYVLDAAEARRADGGLEYHDLLVLARDLLRDSDEARGSLHRRYRHLLLDEFQDTDPIQIELAVLIATSVDHPSGEQWHSLAVPEGSLFFVGDPKQSIYRFRRADIALFLRARDRYGSGDALARLTANFRTVEPVLDWVNAFFARELPLEIPGRQPAYEPLQAVRRAESGADHRPLLIGGEHPDPDVKASVLREAEAEDVASTIRSILDVPEDWPVLDARTGQWRPAEPADVAILLPTRTSLPMLRTALDRARVPYRIATGVLVYDTQEVRDVLSVLRAVDDPSDEISLVAALRSALYGCSDVDLVTYRTAGGRWNLRATPPDSLSSDHPVVAALEHLRTLWRHRWWLSPSALVGRILRERHAFLLGLGTPRPVDVWRRLRFLVDQARAFEEAGGGNVRAFVEWASLQGADGARVHEPLLPESDEAAVRIMTIHGSKGLEFPITILSGMTTKPGNPRNGVSLLWEDGRPPQLRMRKNIQTADHQLRADLENEMDLYEKMRLFYVAATRARDHLVISCHHKQGPFDTYAGWVHRFAEQAGPEGASLVRRPGAPRSGAAGADTFRSETAGDAGRAAVPVLVPGGVGPDGSPTSESVVAPDPTDDPWADRAAWIDERERMLRPFRERRVVSATSLAEAAAAQATTHLTTRVTGSEAAEEVATTPRPGAEPDVRSPVDARRSPLPDEDDDHADDPDTAPYRRRGRAGTAIGVAVHATLQVLDLARPAAITEVVRQQCSAEAVAPMAATVEALVRSALASEAVALAAGNPHHKELYVAAPLGDRVIEGYVDLLVETPEGLVVIDYKTDSVSSEADVDEKLDRYELQAAAYAVALEEVVGRPVVACRFVFCRPSGPIERSVRDLPAAKRRIRELVGG